MTKTRGWEKEPWMATMPIVDRQIFDSADGEPVFLEYAENASRALECVNAMQGWSASEGAVGRLVEAARAYAFGGERGIDLADALREFSPIVEPS